MELKTLFLDQIEIESSPYFFMDTNEPESELSRPPLVYPLDDQRYALVIGKKVLKDCHKGSASAPVLVISKETPLSQILALIFSETRLESASVISKLRYLYFCMGHGIEKQDILSFWLPKLGINSHQASLVEIKKILSVSPETKVFMDKKNLSYRHCLELALRPKEILSFLFSLSSTIALTTSIVLELSDFIHDIMKREGLSVDDLLGLTDIQKALQSELSPHQKTARFRKVLHQKRFPVLVSENEKISKQIQALQLKHVKLSWDKTLENKGITLSATIKNEADLFSLLNELTELKDKKGLRCLRKNLVI